LTGETQLRARRTRIKILRAIADRNGVAGFSDIKVSTGLSTGSIYYHLERMGSYITKDSKHYMITEEGLQLLREVDQKYANIAPPRKEEERAQAPAESFGEETVRQARRWNVRQYAFIGILASVVAFAIAGIISSWQTMYLFSGVSTELVTSIAAAATLSMSLFMLKRSHPLIGYRGMMLSVSVLAALLFSALLVSGLGYTNAASSQSYDNSMDALLSSYSMHWQIR